jgi:hypothetical protein
VQLEHLVCGWSSVAGLPPVTGVGKDVGEKLDSADPAVLR